MRMMIEQGRTPEELEGWVLLIWLLGALGLGLGVGRHGKNSVQVVSIGAQTSSITKLTIDRGPPGMSCSAPTRSC
jgi:hypothetical protein